jgi:hypothetical protein
MIRIPRERLSQEALIGVVDEYIGREGTDYGHRDFTLAEKRARVLAALDRGDAVITWDADSATTTIVPAGDAA